MRNILIIFLYKVFNLSLLWSLQGLWCRGWILQCTEDASQRRGVCWISVLTSTVIAVQKLWPLDRKQNWPYWLAFGHQVYFFFFHFYFETFLEIAPPQYLPQIFGLLLTAELSKLSSDRIQKSFIPLWVMVYFNLSAVELLSLGPLNQVEPDKTSQPSIVYIFLSFSFTYCVSFCYCGCVYFVVFFPNLLPERAAVFMLSLRSSGTFLVFAWD